MLHLRLIDPETDLERLGRVRSVSVDKELRTILGEKGLLEEDLYEEVIAEAPVLDYTKHMTFENIVRDVCSQIAKAEGIDGEELYEGFVLESRAGLMPLDHGIAAPNMRHHDVAHPRMVLVRSKIGIEIDLSESFGHLELDAELLERDDRLRSALMEEVLEAL